MQQTLKRALKSVGLAGLFATCAYATESAEYYSTHKQEREKVLKECDRLFPNLSEAQEAKCERAEEGNRLADQRARKQKKNSLTAMLTQCYIRMADGLEKGQDVLKTDKKCRLLVRRSAFVTYTFGYYPLPQLYDVNVVMDRYPNNKKTHKYDDLKIRHAFLIKCYRTFSSQLRKYGSYHPLKTDFRHECMSALDVELGYPRHTIYDFLRNVEF
ncbi:hypothetical protein ACFOPX_03340 [Helicobacter baculiformis]|uniref:Lipoprotein n=1 Tax=Helicobacter baculiformis TaxID=427351 RepID=A0ABV7ZHH6_9HELI|nr:hypothetical protein [Helicobacter baculiformis]